MDRLHEDRSSFKGGVATAEIDPAPVAGKFNPTTFPAVCEFARTVACAAQAEYRRKGWGTDPYPKVFLETLLLPKWGGKDGGAFMIHGVAPVPEYIAYAKSERPWSPVDVLLLLRIAEMMGRRDGRSYITFKSYDRLALEVNVKRASIGRHIRQLLKSPYPLIRAVGKREADGFCNNPRIKVFALVDQPIKFAEGRDAKHKEQDAAARRVLRSPGVQRARLADQAAMIAGVMPEAELQARERKRERAAKWAGRSATPTAATMSIVEPSAVTQDAPRVLVQSPLPPVEIVSPAPVVPAGAVTCDPSAYDPSKESNTAFEARLAAGQVSDAEMKARILWRFRKQGAGERGTTRRKGSPPA